MAQALEIVCSQDEKGAIAVRRMTKLMGAKAVPRFKANRLLMMTKGEPGAVQRELYKTLGAAAFPIEAIDPARWGDATERMQGIQHLFVDNMVYAPLAKNYARQVVDNMSEFPNAAHAGFANTAALGLLYLRDTGLLIRSDEHDRNVTEMAMWRGRTKPLYQG